MNEWLSKDECRLAFYLLSNSMARKTRNGWSVWMQSIPQSMAFWY